MEDINLLEEKYIELLLKRCLSFSDSKILFISYDKVNKNFIDKVIQYAKRMQISEIVLEEEDAFLMHDKLKTLSISEIKQDPYFDKTKWNTYAKKNASFLMFETYFPNLMNDIDSNKLAQAKLFSNNTRNIFRNLESEHKIPWCIAALPNQIWADYLFKDDDSYDKLFRVILKMCMVDTPNPIESWNNYISEAQIRSDKLNNLQIKKLHYTNNLGTDLYIELPDGAIWCIVGGKDEKYRICNMPSYEVFTTPDYRKTEGIVYSAKPLIYGGGLIDKFYIVFKEGKVVDYGAEKGYEILKNIIESDSNSCYLGEVALVNYNSPISNTKLVFGTTLFDENASCHLALGRAYPTCLKNGPQMSNEELLNHGSNISDTHVDFMIGTNDLKIEAKTINGDIVIFENGNFTI